MPKDSPNKNRKNLISVLIYARSIAGLTQKQLASKLHTKQPAIARLEKGRINFNIEFAEKWCKACNLQLHFQWINLIQKDSETAHFFPKS